MAWDRPPEELFARLCDRPGAFFLDSARPADGLGRYSFIGFDPFLVFRARGGEICLQRAEGARVFQGEVFAELGKLFGKYRCAARTELPFPAGAVGFFSYEFGAQLERVACAHAVDSAVPDVVLGFYDGVLAFDQAACRAFMVANPVDQESVGAIFQRLERALNLAGPSPLAAIKTGALEPQARLPKDDYLRAIARIKDYIAAGDVYQVNLTQRFEVPLACHPYQLYQSLRRRSPAPFASYLNFDPLNASCAFITAGWRRVRSRVRDRVDKLRVKTPVCSGDLSRVKRTARSC
jgi:para-aminobenzoate synthetase component 1